MNAEVERAVEGLLVFQHGEDDEVDLGFFGAQCGGNFQAVQAGQADIEDGDVGF